MKFDLTNKNIVITGAGSGIGKAIARTLAGQGAQIYIFEKNEHELKAVVQQIKNDGGKAKGFIVDVTDLMVVQNSINLIEAEVPIHILVNNAGIGHIGTVANTQPEDFDRLYNINVKGYYHLIHAVIPYMKQRRQGSIVNIASVSGIVGISERFAYSVSKGAVLSMTRSVAKDFVKENIRCNSISPGRVHTPFVDGYIEKNYPGREQEIFDQLSKTQPIGRMGEPEEIANLVLYLCSDEASFVTGTDFPIDGGFVTLNS